MVGSRRGYSLELAARTIDLEYQDWDVTHPDAVAWVRAELREGRWLIVQTFTAAMAKLARSAWKSPFGAPPDTLGLMHAIVLVGFEDERLTYLDPWYGPDGQPFEMSQEQFARVWQAGVVVIR